MYISGRVNSIQWVEDGRTAPGVCGNGSVPLSHSGNVVTRTGIHTRIQRVNLKPRYNDVTLKDRHWLEVVLIFLINKIKIRLMRGGVNLQASELDLVERDSLLEFKTSA